jgi:hypothetical protein
VYHLWVGINVNLWYLLRWTLSKLPTSAETCCGLTNIVRRSETPCSCLLYFNSCLELQDGGNRSARLRRLRKAVWCPELQHALSCGRHQTDYWGFRFVSWSTFKYLTLEIALCPLGHCCWHSVQLNTPCMSHHVTWRGFVTCILPLTEDNNITEC